MKTKLLYRFVLITLVIPSLALGKTATGWSGKHSKQKTVNKEFAVSKNATLKVDNSFGNIDIVTYDGSKVLIEVNIKTNGNDLEKVESKLNQIEIKFSASPDWVAAETLVGKKNSNSWWSWGKKKKVNIEINYIIKLPVTNNVNLNNDYGSINLDTLEGKAEINCDYGKITTKELMADNNIINFDYTNHSYFEYIKSGKINADYSSFTVAKAKSLDLVTDYSDSKIEVAENITYNCDYGSMNVMNVNNINGSADNLTLRLGSVYKNVDIKADYGTIKIDQMTANAGNINIKSDYTGITIGYNASYHFNFEIGLDNGTLRNHDGFQFSIQNVNHSDKFYKGYYGSANSSNLVRIKSDYGNISFKKH
ncbi:hypothetical protein [uncultured Psychroserpens sp.]|uniref:hypothetical protein n=1 Tax=uncultured Psychroserpens sp. TaxID=255436 RepID=UPI00262569BD|nr:hypothetical protein [uncultured Psychroserpens sp.]